MAVECNHWRSNQDEENGRGGNIPSEVPTSARKNPSRHDGQEGCVWLEKITETIVAAASESADQWCWAEQQAVLPGQTAELELTELQAGLPELR
jgi:hypothetical protein